MLLLLPSIITLALMDSLNPSTIAAQVFLLLGVKKPVSRVVSFILGTFVMYAVFGFVVVFAIGQPMKGYIYDMGSTDYIILLAIGMILIAVGTALVFRRYVVKGGRSKSEGYMKKAMAPMLAMLKTLNPFHTFFFGMGTTAFDLPTSAFYFVAIASIIEAGTDPYEMIVLLMLYNLLYILPLVLILLIYLTAKDRSEPLMNRINMAIGKWSGRLTILFLFLIGIILVVLSASFFLNWHLI